MYSISDSGLLSNAMDQPQSSVINPAAQLMPPVRLVQAVPLLHALYPPPPLVMSQVPRMPTTVLPQPLAIGGQPTTTIVGQQPVTWSSWRNQNTSSSTKTTDAMQIFLERAEKSGIKLEAVPESYVHTNAGRQAGVRPSSVMYTVKSSPLAGIHTQAPSVSASQPSLNISCAEFVPWGQAANVKAINAPEFVPRGQQVATSEMSFQQCSNTLTSKSSERDLRNSVLHPFSSLNSRVGQHSRGVELTSCVPSCSVYNVQSMLTVSDLPEHFANISVDKSRSQPVLSSSAQRFQDASSQTASVNMVDACTGSSSVLLVDASTNTPHYDRTDGLQQVLVSTATNIDMQSDHGTRVNASYVTATNQSSVEASGIDRGLQNRSFTTGSPSNRWADCWRGQGQSPQSVENDETSNCHFSDASENLTPSVTNVATSNASRYELSSLHFKDSNEMHDTVTKLPPLNVHQMHNSCECTFSNCPFASPRSDVNSNLLEDQSADMSSSLFATGHASGYKITQKPSSEDEKLLHEEDLSEEVYYSDEESQNILPGDEVTHSASCMENVASPLLTEDSQGHAPLLAQLTNGSLPSQATIELAIAQLVEVLTADEKPLMAQMMQQIALMNPVLAAANPLAPQVEAIRIVLTTRGQRLQQMALQAQLQNLPQNSVSLGMTAAAQATSVTAQEEPCPAAAAAAAVNRQEDVPYQPQMSKPRHHYFHESSHQAPVTKCDDSFTLDTEPKYRDESSSASSDHAHPGAGHRPAKGRGRGVFVRGDDEMFRQDRPRGRGLRRTRAEMCIPVADETSSPRSGNSSAAVRQPLVPPRLHTAQTVHQSADPQGEPAVDDSENWEQEIDEFGSGVFHVKSSFFKSGKR